MKIENLNLKIELFMAARMIMQQLVNTKCVEYIDLLQVEDDENFDSSPFCDIWYNDIRVFVYVENNNIFAHASNDHSVNAPMAYDQFILKISPNMFNKNIDNLTQIA